MEFIRKGIYTYLDGLGDIDSNTLPIEMVISDRISNEAILIRLLCGTLKIQYSVNGRKAEIEQRKNYSTPGIGENNVFKNKIVRDFFSFNYFRKTEKKSINKYLNSNRRNFFVHSEVLSELTSAIIWMESSPIESFVHIYRALEFMSYSFPLIYASKSMDYRGSYGNLKKFMSGDSDGELKFFKTFLKELFKNNILFQYEFEIYFLNGDETLIEQELQRVLNNISYTFDGNTMKIRFVNIIDLIVILRNRYFHMLLGKGTNNFYDIQYDKRELFYAMNPVFMNWMTLVYREIVIYSIGII